ncbi:MAG: spermine/spermidine synthase domain-containing protein [Aggregatilineales bacterium]
MDRYLFRIRLLALFMVSATLIAYEVAVMRIFAVGSWSNFGSLVISIALLGIGLAGTLLTLFSRLRQHATRLLRVTAILLGPTLAGSYIAAQQVPFNPVMIGVDQTQWIWVGLYFVIYAVPFFIGAVFIGTIFVELQQRIHQVYFWNMVGSGVGGAFILGLMYLLPPERLIAPLIILTTLIALLCFTEPNPGMDHLQSPVVPTFLMILMMIVTIGLLVADGKINVSDFKPISYARQFPDAKEVYHSWGPTGEYSVYQSSYFHFAPGLSDNASLNIQSMPENAFLGLYIDGQGPIGVMRNLQPAEKAYFDYLPMTAPYLLLREPDVLFLRLDGGLGIASALYYQAQTISAVEPDPMLIDILKNDQFIKQFNGNLLNDRRLTIYNTEPRAFTNNTQKRFDLVEIGLVDSVGLSQTGGYQLNENYLYTTEGIESYLGTLKPDGILSITVWNRLDPPRNVPKLLTTVIEALNRRGVKSPGKHLFVFDSLLSTATILVKNSEFTETDRQTLLQYLRKTSFEPCYYAGMPDPGKDFPAILQAYRDRFASQSTGSEVDISGPSLEFTPTDFYYYTIDWLLSGNANQLYSQYLFNILPATDDRPYYTGYVKPSTIPLIFNNINDLSEEWGYILEVGSFLLSAIFGACVILIPLVGRWRELFNRYKITSRVIIYYAALGIGYMAVEIFLIQRLVFFLGNPIFSSTAVLTAMLSISGSGALVAGSYRGGRRQLIIFAVIGIVLTMICYIALLPAVTDALLGWPLILKILLSVIIVAPGAFFLGIPFPTGLKELTKHKSELVPWAWGINGAFSVTGTSLAHLVSISWGFSVVLIGVIFLYLLALLTFSGSQVSA